MEKTKLVKTDLDAQITELVSKTDHKTLVTWACDCAERVLSYFKRKYPKDNRPRKAIEAGRAWVRDELKMADARKAAFTAHAAARDAGQVAEASLAARSAGHASATAHVASHAVYAAIYAATAVLNTAGSTDSAVTKERGWQYQHLLDLRENTKF